MAVIDLSRFSPNIRQDNRQRQAFGEDDASIYEAISKVSGNLADLSMQVVKKNERQKELEYQSRVNGSLTESEANFEKKWEDLSRVGTISDENGDTYLKAKSKFFDNEFKRIQDDTGDIDLFNKVSPSLQEYKSKKMAKGITEDSTRYSRIAGKYNYENLAEKSLNKLVTLDAMAVPAYYNNEFLPELDLLDKNMSLVDPISSKEMKSATLKQVSKVWAEKVLNNDFKMYPIQKVLDDTVPVNIFMNGYGKMMIDLLNQGEADLESGKIKKQAVIDVSKEFFLNARKNILVKQQSKNAKLSAEEANATLQKIDNYLGIIDKKEKELEEGTISSEMPLKGKYKRVVEGAQKIEDYDISQYKNSIEKASKETGVPKNIIASVMVQETGGKNIKGAIDKWEKDQPTGEKAGDIKYQMVNGVKMESRGYGVMQLTPAVLDELKVKDWANTDENIMAGARFLAKKFKQYGDWKKAAAAYNAGSVYRSTPDWQKYQSPKNQDYIASIFANVNTLGITAEELGLDANTFSVNELVDMNHTEGKKAYGLFNEMTPTDKINLFSNILAAKTNSASYSKTDLDKVMEEKVSKSFVLGDSKGTSDDIFNLYKSNKEEYKNSKMDVINKMFEAEIGSVMYDMMEDPTKLARQFDKNMFEDIRVVALNSLIERFKDSAPELYDMVVLSEGDIGRTKQEELMKKANSTFRNIQKAMSDSPEKAMMLYGSRKLNEMANRSFNPDGSINETNLRALSTMFTKDFAEYATSWNVDASQKLLTTVASKYYNSMRNFLETASPENMAVVTNNLTKLSPEFGSKLITAMESSGKISKDVGYGLRVSFVTKNMENKGLANRLISDSQGDNLKNLKVLFSKRKDEGFDGESIKDIDSDIRSELSNFYKFSADLATQESLVAHIRNHVLTEFDKNSALDIAEYSKRVINNITNNKANFNSSSIKGTVFKNNLETQEQLLKNYENKFETLKANIVKGSVQVDFAKIPGYTKYLGNVATDKAVGPIMRELFVNKNYQMTAESLDDSGNGRDLYIVVRDSTTGAKAILKDTTGKAIKITADITQTVR